MDSEKPPDAGESHTTLLRQRWHSTIDQHRLRSGKIEPPLLQVPNLAPFDGARDLLPELLWLDAVVRSYTPSVAFRHVDAVLEAFDVVKPKGQGILGTISELALASDEQSTVLAALSSEQRALSFPSPFREAVAMYPEFPGRFLIDGLDFPAEHEVAVDWTRESIMRLLDRRSETGAYVNTVLLRGVFRAGRISIPARGTEELQAALLAYPHGTDEQNSFVEGFARSSIGAMSDNLLPADYAWAKHFWRTNRRLVECRPWV